MAQQRYTVTKRELISIVETLKEFIIILISHKLRIYTDHIKLTCNKFNTDRVLIWRLILEEYGPYIEYIKGEKNMVSEKLSILPLNGNKETAHNSIYQKEIVSEINDTEEIPEGNFPIILKWIHRYQRAEPSMIAKYKNGTYHKGSFYGVDNTDLNFITCEDKIVIPEKLQSYIFHWCHTYSFVQAWIEWRR